MTRRPVFSRICNRSKSVFRIVITWGDLEFAQDAEGTAFDILIMAGDNVFVIFNNTRLSLMAIAKCTTWADAQLPLVKLAEHFNSDPLLLR